MSPAKVYKILNTTGILDNYIIKCYDVLHTQGKEYLVEDITDYVREKGVNVWLKNPKVVHSIYRYWKVLYSFINYNRKEWKDEKWAYN